jgi:hypothetical protein
MPFSVDNDPAACSVEKPWAVKTEGSGKVHGCHATEAEARKQLEALYANGADKDTTLEASGDPSSSNDVAVDGEKAPVREHFFWRR